MAQAPPQFDVAIVGFGPVGGFLALLLCRARLRVCVLETSDGERLSPRAVAIDDSVVRMCVQRAGLLERFLSTAEQCPHLQMVSDWTAGSGEPPRLILGDQTPPGRPGAWAQFKPPSRRASGGAMATWQPQLESDIRNELRALGTCTILFNHTVTQILDAGDQVSLRADLAPGHWTRDEGNEWKFHPSAPTAAVAVSARFVVGCDGARSTVRKLVFSDSRFASFGYDKHWVACDLLVTRPDALIGTTLPSFNHHIFGKRQYIIIHGTGKSDAVRGKHLRVDFQVLPGDPDVAHSQAFVERMLRPLGVRIGGPGAVEFVRAASYEFHTLIAPSWRRQSVFLAGDACHVMPPFLGQGLNQGLRDAAALAWRLQAVLRGVARDGLLDTYQQDRFDVALRAVKSSAQVGQMAERFAETGRLEEDNLVWRFYATKPSVQRYRGLVEGDELGGSLFARRDDGGADEFVDAGALFYLLFRGALAKKARERCAELGGKAVALPGGVAENKRAVLLTPELFVFGSVARDEQVEGLVELFASKELAADSRRSAL